MKAVVIPDVKKNTLRNVVLDNVNPVRSFRLTNWCPTAYSPAKATRMAR